jgi:hypothetical protein
VVVDLTLASAATQERKGDAAQDVWQTDSMGHRYQPVKARGLPDEITAGQRAGATVAFRATRRGRTPLRLAGAADGDVRARLMGWSAPSTPAGPAGARRLRGVAPRR